MIPAVSPWLSFHIATVAIVSSYTFGYACHPLQSTRHTFCPIEEKFKFDYNMHQEKSEQAMKINAKRRCALFIIYNLHSSHWRMGRFKVDLIPVFSDFFVVSCMQLPVK